jgi:hypothetical protein
MSKIRPAPKRPAALVASAALVLAATAGGVLIASSPASAHIRIATAFGGIAYGSNGNIGTMARSGRSALVPLCTSTPGLTRADHTQRSSAPKVGTIGSVHTSVSSNSHANTIASVSTARTLRSSLFGKAITGDAFAVAAKASRVSEGYVLSGSTTLTDVKVLGKAVPTHPSVNQKMAVPGIGRVVFNKQTRTHGFGTEQISVIAMQVTLSGDNTLGLPAGSLVVSAARASLHKPTYKLASGNAFGTTIASDDQVQSGKTAPVYLPCGGTSGATRTNASGAVTTHAVTSSITHTRARSAETADGTTATLTSSTSGVNLLRGVVRAKTLVSRASASRTNGRLTRSSTGTSIDGFMVNGEQKSANQPANTKWTIPGVGTLWVHRVITTPNGVHVYALQLVLAHDRAGLSKGSVITVGGAFAAVAK